MNARIKWGLPFTARGKLLVVWMQLWLLATCTTWMRRFSLEKGKQQLKHVNVYAASIMGANSLSFSSGIATILSKVNDYTSVMKAAGSCWNVWYFKNLWLVISAREPWVMQPSWTSFFNKIICLLFDRQCHDVYTLTFHHICAIEHTEWNSWLHITVLDLIMDNLVMIMQLTILAICTYCMSRFSLEEGK